MTTKELIAKLKKCPQDAVVVMSRDAEGNGYSPLADVDPDCVYRAESTWHGEIWSTGWSADDACMDSDEWEEHKKTTPRAVVLEPTN